MHNYYVEERHNMLQDDLIGDKRLVGTKQVLRALTDGRLTAVYIAEDADAALKKKIADACIDAGVTVRKAPSMLELGIACGINVGAACAAVYNGDNMSKTN